MHNVFISCKESRIENNRSFYGCFNIGPFDAAQSLTIGNALRRTLLSECPGLGITSVSINNVSHEYSTLPGMRESVLDLLLNLKEIVFTVTTNNVTFSQSNEAIEIRRKNLLINNISSVFTEGVSLNSRKNLNDTKTKLLLKSKDTLNLLISKRKHLKKPLIGYLKVKGPGIIRARDLKLPPFIQCVDGNQYIATLADDGFLSMKFILMEGKGYIIQKNLVAPSLSLHVLDSAKPKGLAALREPTSEQNEIHNRLITKRTEFVNQLEKSLNINERKKQTSTNNINTSNYTTNFVNSKPLNLDCVFNPVTKVSYIIEDFNNKLINDFNYSFNFANDVTSLVESSYYLQNLNSHNEKSKFDKAQTIAEHTILSQNIVNLVDSYSKDEIQELLTYLNNPPLQKPKSLNNIVLEIWTNGGIHPREALTVGFQNLSSLFLNFKKL